MIENFTVFESMRKLLGESESGVKLTIHKMCEEKDKRMGKQIEEKAWPEIIYNSINKKIMISKALYTVNITTVTDSSNVKKYVALKLLGNEIVLKSLPCIKDCVAVRFDIRKNSDSSNSNESFIVIRY